MRMMAAREAFLKKKAGKKRPTVVPKPGVESEYTKRFKAWKFVSGATRSYSATNLWFVEGDFLLLLLLFSMASLLLVLFLPGRH